ncbi:hypothetical protein B0T22DRAFT_490349 [Podospora appendiculata]|uniref:Uncharacterized protein n=1 Tax=Podospora appendiculata TaxID=314037 RepID=A0AAE0X9V9_9PEZI|nr:hypothetical protein B0T22DRAFT_490349 [Podospora appendiculata]
MDHTIDANGLTTTGYIMVVLGSILSVVMGLAALEGCRQACTAPPSDLEEGNEIELQAHNTNAPGNDPGLPPYSAHQGA